MNLNMSTLLSGLRILATGGIFTFHAFGLLGLDNKNIDTYAICIFCVLSGFFSIKVHKNPMVWFFRRIFSIMIPYWVVIIPVIVLNHAVHYKETTFIMDIITLLGGNLFLNNPIYVIAWYITLINMFYLIIFFQSILKSIIMKAIIWILGWVCIGFLFNMSTYFIGFLLGYLGAHLIPPPKKDLSATDMGNRILFALQDKCYCFFLLHGGVLIFLFFTLKKTDFNIYWWGILISCLVAIILRKMTKPFIELATNKLASLTFM